MAEPIRILIAEDDRDIAQLIAHYVQKAGWLAHLAESGDEALAYARRESVDVVVLDLMLPGMSGLEVCRSLRADRATARLPIIMVTARSEETDRIFGLDLGADDYLAKPFSPNELVARIRAVMRRSRPDDADESVLRYGQLTMDVLHHTVADGERERSQHGALERIAEIHQTREAHERRQRRDVDPRVLSPQVGGEGVGREAAERASRRGHGG